MDKADQYIERLKHLPPAPVVANQLRPLLADPNRDMDRVTDLIRHDPALTAEVLKRSNSVFFRGAEPAVDVLEAVTRMGFSEVTGALTALVGAETGAPVRPDAARNAGDLWWHSVATAVVAAVLAQRVQEVEAIAFTAGLLHDIGKLVLGTVEAATYAGLLREAGSSGSGLAMLEEGRLGATHAEVGARLLARWGLAGSIILAVQHHQDSSTQLAAPAERLVAIVRVANALAHHFPEGAAASPVVNLADANPEALRLLRLAPEDLPGVLDQTQLGLRRVETLLRIAG